MDIFNHTMKMMTGQLRNRDTMEPCVPYGVPPSLFPLSYGPTRHCACETYCLASYDEVALGYAEARRRSQRSRDAVPAKDDYIIRLNHRTRRSKELR